MLDQCNIYNIGSTLAFQRWANVMKLVGFENWINVIFATLDNSSFYYS